jgi:alkylated DNA repair dioxygenase AlkB
VHQTLIFGYATPALLPLRAQAAAFAGIEADSLQQILINKYAPGAGIGWHGSVTPRAILA